MQEGKSGVFLGLVSELAQARELDSFKKLGTVNKLAVHKTSNPT